MRGTSSSRAGWRVWLPALLVAVCAVAATAHGLYEVAVASRVPWPIAALYPVVTDGLALVAYAATHRLRGAACAYAWVVTVLAAGLSGLAQAAYLASEPLVASQEIRFGVGAWPAVAAAIVAHLLYLLARPAPHPLRVAVSPATHLPVPAGVASTLADATPAVRVASAPATPPAVEVVGEPGPWRPRVVADLVANLHATSPVAPPHATPVASPKATPLRRPVATVTAKAATPPPPMPNDDPVAKARRLLADGAGRRRLSGELGIKPHQARALLDKPNAVDELVPRYLKANA